MKILELFSGYGTSSFALKQLKIPYELIGYSDIDKYANQCFQQNHGGKELGDVNNINTNDLEDFDLLTGGFPCQSFSVAGKMQGEIDTRGTLFKEIIRIAEAKKPKYMLLENVKGLTCKKFKDTFEKILSELDRINYNVYWKVLNTKDFGIPQSRARVWFVCFRKDIDKGTFKFPEPIELKIFIKDILEEQVDDKYYLSEKLQERFAKYLEDKNKIVNLQPRQGKGIGGKGIISKNDGTTYCLDSGNCQGIVAMRGRNPDNPKSRVAGLPTEQQLEFKEDGCSNSLTSVQKDNLVCLGNVQQTCIKRTFETPKEINEFLRINKKEKTINEIADLLNLPKTQIEHYFRTDESRAIPSPENWNKLKLILSFDDTYDKQVTDIYEKEIEFEQTRRVYDSQGLSPTLNTIKEPMIYDSHRANEIREYEGVSYTLSQAMGTGGNNVPMVANCLDSNMFKGITPFGFYDKSRRNIINQGKLRRLTPKECFRLQGFLNDEVNLEGLSDTQCYKLAGNGQSVNVVKLIFQEMFL